MMSFTDRLNQKPVMVLDGAVGTELERRGISLELPLWSTIALLTHDGRKTLRSIHRDYAVAGAEILTANTFRTNPYTLRKENIADKAATFTRNAVEEARSAIDQARVAYPVYVAGSIAPVEDCYRPDLTPPDAVLWDDHRRHVDNLFAAGVDIFLVETMNTLREAALVAGYALQTGRPVIVSFILKDHEHLLGGDVFEESLRAMTEIGPNALMLNCVDLDLLDAGLKKAVEETVLPLGCYANLVGKTEKPDTFAEKTSDLVKKYRLSIAGGCCGTTPEHIGALQKNVIEI